MNHWIGLLDMVTAFICLMIVYRFLEWMGLFVWFPEAIILSKDQVVNTIKI
ncbi:MAG: hypothetical protein SNJ56_04880 [Termitinemataceae bacterium]